MFLVAQTYISLYPIDSLRILLSNKYLVIAEFDEVNYSSGSLRKDLLLLTVFVPFVASAKKTSGEKLF